MLCGSLVSLRCGFRCFKVGWVYLCLVVRVSLFDVSYG